MLFMREISSGDISRIKKQPLQGLLFDCTPILFLPFVQILTKLIFFPCALNFASYSVRKVRDFSA